MATNAWRYSGTIVLFKSALHSSTRRLHSATVPSGVDEVVIEAFFVILFIDNSLAFCCLAILRIVATVSTCPSDAQARSLSSRDSSSNDNIPGYVNIFSLTATVAPETPPGFMDRGAPWTEVRRLARGTHVAALIEPPEANC